MMRRSWTGKVIAPVLVLVLTVVALPAHSGVGSASLTGHVLSADSLRPLVGVRVQVGDPATGVVRSSEPTAQDGSFQLAGLPASSYQVAVRSDQGVYLVQGGLQLAAGETRKVQVGVRPNHYESAPSPESLDESSKKGASWWNNPFTATLIVLGGAVLIGLAVDQASDDDPSSPSAP